MYISKCLKILVRVNDSQLVMLSERAHYDHSVAGYLHKRTSDSTKWQIRWFVLYQVNIIMVTYLSFLYNVDTLLEP